MTTTTTTKPKRKGFDTGEAQPVRGEKYDPRNQWGSGPFERTSSVESSQRMVYPDLPFGGYFMSGEQIAQAGPRYEGGPLSVPSPGEQTTLKGGRADLPPIKWNEEKAPPKYATPPSIKMEDLQPVASNSAKVVMDRIVRGLEESSQAQKNLLARYKPASLKDRSFFA